MGTTRRSRTLDAAAALWVALWLVVALALGSAAWGLGDVTDAARQAASGTDQAGRAVQQLGDLPLVPDRVGALGGSIRDSAGRLDEQAVAARTSVHRLALALALTLFAAATAPVWLVHLPLRARSTRTVRAVRSFLDAAEADGRADGRAEAWLAQRAVVHLPPARLLAITDDPAGDLVAGRHHALARAELARLGIDPRTRGPVDPAPAPRPLSAPEPPPAPRETQVSRALPYDDRADTSWDA